MDTNGLPKTRAEAKALGASHYFTGEPCKHGHIAPRKTKGTCTECAKEEWKQSAVTRADYFRAYNKQDSVRERKHEWYEAHKDEVIARAKTTPPAVHMEYHKAWADRNKDVIRANTKARRRKHQQATPPWMSYIQKNEIKSVYRAAISMTRLTGEQYVVDHIYPLRSDVVCGLHVPWNLRVVTRAENLEKSNKLPDDSLATAYVQPGWKW